MITGYSIEQVLPHAHPMILLSNFIQASSDYAVCSVQIVASSPFFSAEQQAVPSYVGLEYMAQTVAAFAGANSLQQGGPVKMGFLLGCRKYQPLVSKFALGTELIVRASQLVADEAGLCIFDCQIWQQQQLLVEAKLNVFQPDDYRSWLTEQP